MDKDLMKPSDDSVIIAYRKRKLIMHYIFESELKTLGTFNLQAGIHIGLFGVGLGSFITFLITLLTVALPSPTMFASFLALTVVSGIASVYFGVRTAIDIREAKRQINEIIESKDEILNSNQLL